MEERSLKTKQRQQQLRLENEKKRSGVEEKNGVLLGLSEDKMISYFPHSSAVCFSLTVSSLVFLSGLPSSSLPSTAIAVTHPWVRRIKRAQIPTQPQVFKIAKPLGFRPQSKGKKEIKGDGKV
ncbi:hypothetical protein LguiA_033441 [Lonicera macranthoides]